MSKYFNRFKFIVFAIFAMSNINVIAQTPKKVSEKLSKVNEVSLEDVNGFSKDSSFF